MPPKWTDHIDLNTKTNLTEPERNQIASVLHALLLDEFYSHRAWETHMAVFHGGTALALLYNSGRFSEDLDFMVSEVVFDTLAKAMKSARSKVEINASQVFAGGKLELSGPKGDKVQNWIFGWTHPNRRGKVKVKVEFLPTPAELLKFYRTARRPIMAQDLMIPKSLSSVVTGPLYVSSWADKIVAMAERPVFKWRDVYDLQFLLSRIDHYHIVNEEKFVALGANIDIYKTSLENVQEGLQRRIDEGIFDNPAEYAESMNDWVPEEIWDRWNRTGLFADHLAASKKEVLWTIDAIQDLINGAAPSP